MSRTTTRIALLLATGVAALAPAAASQAAVKTTSTTNTVPARVTPAPKHLPSALVAGNAGGHYTDLGCQRLADEFVRQVNESHQATKDGNPLLASSYLDAAAATLNELEDNCFIING